MKKGLLILVPTPLQESQMLVGPALELLRDHLEKGDALFCVEDAKPGRRRWLSWGLPRSEIENLICYNEHTRDDLREELIAEMKKGKTLFLMSDGGLPAFCDPGKDLVKRCHDEGIRVTSTPFENSVILALALSGFDHEQFFFGGFPPRDKAERKNFYKEILKKKETIILMDAPYRLPKVLAEIDELGSKRELFLAMDLGSEDELLIRGSAQKLIKKVNAQKAEFILIIDSMH